MTLNVDCDLSKWLYVPVEWPWADCASPDEWSAWVAEVTSEAHGYTEGQKGWLQSSLEGLARSIGPAEYRFVYFVDPVRTLSFLSLYEIPRQEHESYDSLLGLGDPASIRTPKVVEFISEGLGRGRKSLRFVESGERRDITAVAHWVWRLDDRDIAVIAAGHNIAEFDMLQHEFDEFSRSISRADDDFHLARAEG